MASTTIWKPVTNDGNPAFLTDISNPRTPPVLVLPNGQRVSGSLKSAHEGRLKYTFPPSVLGQTGATIEYNGQSYPLESTSQSYEGFGPDWKARDKGSAGSSAGGATGGPYGFVPENIESKFPSAVTTKYDPITAAPYKFVDPIEFGKKFGNFQRQELEKNFAQSKEFALDAIDTEFEALASYVPRSAKLKADVIAADNQFNQGQRTQQLQQAVPDVLADQDTVAANARTYSQGRVPDSVTDRALELGNRSAATDLASAQGFGVKSGAAQKFENLLAAKDRIQLQQYGDQLLGKSAQERAALRLAPTEYNNAGSQINVNPTVSGSQLQQQNFQEVNNQTLVNPNTALQNKTQQEQFVTTLEDSIRKFNSSNTLQNDQFNANNLNNFALNKFSYQVGYANSQAAAAQTDAQTKLALQQQADALKTFADFLEKAQGQGTTNSIAQGLGQLLTAVKNVIELFKGDGKDKVSDAAGTGTNPDKTGGGSTGKPNDASSGNSVSNVKRPKNPTDKKPVQDIDPEFPSNDKPSEDTSEDEGQGTKPDDDAGTAAPSAELPSEGDGSNIETIDPDTGKPYTDQSLSSRDIQRSASTTGDPGLKGLQAATGRTPTSRDVDKAQKMYQMLDLSTEPKDGYSPAGYNQAGQAVYQKDKANPNNFFEGALELTAIQKILKPLEVFKDPLDAKNFQTIINTVGEVQNLITLSQFVKNKDAKGFIDHVIKNSGAGLAKALLKDPKDQAGADAAIRAYTLFSNWDNLDATGKGVGLARIGISAYKFRTGEDLGKKVIVGPTVKGTAPEAQLTVGEALSLVSTGHNIYSLVKNWDQYNNFEKVLEGSKTALSVAEAAKSVSKVGFGSSNAVVPGITKANLAANGLTPVASQGIGALSGTASSTVPAGYTVVNKAADGSFIIVPTENIGSYVGKTGGYAAGRGGGSAAGRGVATPGGPNYLQGAAGAVGIALGTKAVYDNWGAGGTKGALNGALGGATIAAGMSAMASSGLGAAAMANPYVLGAVVAISIVGGAVHTGKSDEQLGRDAQRNWAVKAKIADDKFQITLADGTKADIGADGGARVGGFANRDKLVAAHKDLDDKRHTYDVDYTNDLDYATSMGASALIRLGQGGKSDRSDQLAGQMTNALLSNIGEGKEMSQENFGKAMANLRAQFSKMGIKDKASGYQLANQAFSEKRLNDTDTVTIHQALNMMYDENGYDTARKLMAGRFRGIDIAASGQASGTKDTVSLDKVNAKPPAKIPGPGDKPLTEGRPDVLPGVRPGERPTFPAKPVDPKVARGYLSANFGNQRDY